MARSCSDALSVLTPSRGVSGEVMRCEAMRVVPSPPNAITRSASFTCVGVTSSRITDVVFTRGEGHAHTHAHDDTFRHAQDSTTLLLFTFFFLVGKKHGTPFFSFSFFQHAPGARVLNTT